MYAKTGPEEMFSILQKYNASYIILEDSICLAYSERCALPDIMDLSNGHVRFFLLLIHRKILIFLAVLDALGLARS